MHRLDPRSATFRCLFGPLTVVSIIATLWGGGLVSARQGDPTPTPEVANLPAVVEVRFSAELTLLGGDYQWQLTERSTLQPGDEPITVNRGIVIAFSGPVLVSQADAGLDQVEQGKGLLLEVDDRILPISLGAATEQLLIAELLDVTAPVEALPTETPDHVAPSAVDAGTSIVAVLYVPAAEDAKTVAEAVIANAIAPGLSITEPEPFGGTPDEYSSAPGSHPAQGWRLRMRHGFDRSELQHESVLRGYRW